MKNLLILIASSITLLVCNCTNDKQNGFSYINHFNIQKSVSIQSYIEGIYEAVFMAIIQHGDVDDLTKEEFDIDTKEEDFEFFDTSSAPAANSPEKTVTMDTFMVKNFVGEPTPSSEVEELRWVTMDDIGKLAIGSIFEHNIMPRLKEMDLIN